MRTFQPRRSDIFSAAVALVGGMTINMEMDDMQGNDNKPNPPGQQDGSPSLNGASTARDGHGHFKIGNPGGPGNPHGRRVNQLRAMLMAAVTDDDLREIARTLIAQAKGGDLPAIRELLDRTIGKPAQTELLERVEALEALVHDLSKETPK